MTECPTCKLAMESHSTTELLECCMKQVDDGFSLEAKNKEGICPNCKHSIKLHSNEDLAECTLAYLKSGLKS